MPERARKSQYRKYYRNNYAIVNVKMSSMLTTYPVTVSCYNARISSDYISKYFINDQYLAYSCACLFLIRRMRHLLHYAHTIG